ncbi:testis-specific Y-encoded-like protein 5 [Dasypus novemcinctus]|uniref:testis-specific Y-encoded-like protein 5 n=1 Tax=Dasypus novemcinctus TaxID=9361 RepID=UPI000328EA33|nr:testis-specific Y-encoded-like protein 5 [Dasypus novemcinctus]
MSGRSRGRKSPCAKSQGKGRTKARIRPASDDTPRDRNLPECQRRGEETESAQVQAGAGGGGLETAAPAPRRSPGEGDACRLPLDCGLTLQARAAGDRGQVATRARPGKVPSLSERLETDTVFVGTVGTVGRRKNGSRVGNRRGLTGKKAPGARSALGRGPQAIASGKKKKGRSGECASVSGGKEKKVAKNVGSGSLAIEGSMDTLESVQLKLETMNAQADRAYLRLSRKFGQLRLHHLERRNLLIQNIAGFWGRALQNHPQLSSFLSNQDKEVLSSLTSLEVEELGLARLGYKIKFYFGPNRFFQNKALIKEYGCGPTGQVVSRATPIQWLPGQDLQSLSQEHPDHICSFFGWFSNHSAIESDKIFEIINEELWPNPLQYYLMSDETLGEKGKDRRGSAREPIKSLEPGVNQSD